MQSKIAKDEAGFTLIELLIALLLFGLLSAAVFTALRFGATSLDRVADSGQSAERYLAAEQVLTLYLAAAYPENVAQPNFDTLGAIAFDGQPKSINFVSQSPQDVADGGLSAMRLWIDDDRADTKLILSASPELAWPNSQSVDEEVLFDGIADGVFSYFGPDHSGSASYWHKSWEGHRNLPLLVRISLRRNGSAKPLPDLLVAPRIRVGEECAVSTQSAECVGQ